MLEESRLTEGLDTAALPERLPCALPHAASSAASRARSGSGRGRRGASARKSTSQAVGPGRPVSLQAEVIFTPQRGV